MYTLLHLSRQESKIRMNSSKSSQLQWTLVFIWNSIMKIIRLGIGILNIEPYIEAL